MPKFKPGDKVVIIRKDLNYFHWNSSMDKLIGEVVEVYNYFPEKNTYFVLHNSGLHQYPGSGTTELGWFITEESLQLYSSSSAVSSTISNIVSGPQCPRCNGKLIKKIAQEPFTGKDYTIDKCKDCGWC